MSSKPLDKPLDKLQETSCKKCKFAIYDGQTQTGCEDNRIEKYLEQDRCFEAYDNEKEFYVIRTLCSCYMEKTVDLTLDQMKELSKKTFGIGIYVDKGCIEEDFLKTVQSIADCEYDHGLMTVCISHHYSIMDSRVKSMIMAGMKILEEASFRSVKVIVFGQESRRDIDCFKYIGKNHYVSKISPGDVLPLHMLSGVDDAINKDLRRAIAFRCDDVVMLLMKAVNGRYLDHNDYDKMQEAVEKEAIEMEMFLEI